MRPIYLLEIRQGKNWIATGPEWFWDPQDKSARQHLARAKEEWPDAEYRFCQYLKLAAQS